MFDEKRVSEITGLLKGKRAKRVLVQVPEGLKTGVQVLSDALEKNGFDVLVSIEPCFGACDLRDREAKSLDCDALLHIGHADMGIASAVPVIYYDYFMDYDFVPLLRDFENQIKYKNICLVTTVQFLGALKAAKKYMEGRGFSVRDGGKIMGCDALQAKKYEKMVDCYLFIGSGRFHPLGLQERVGKPVLFLDIENRRLENLMGEKNKSEIKRRLRIEKARVMKNFGILVSTKPGQSKIKLALKIRRDLKAAGKNAYVLVGDYFTAEKLLGMKIDVLVNTSCPRIRDDFEQFNKVILNPEDVELLLKDE
ncbi:MAG: diphthamide biosynthesis enzyme Dph2 [Candidatus Aenigmatarchaeota archaeon]